MQALRDENYYTYEDYYSWDDGERWELIDGVPYAMSPAPSRKHQGLLGKLHVQFYDFLRGKPCEVYLAPFDVRLNADTYDDTVVQPDLIVVCDTSKLDDRGCVGAPDLAIEILSPSTSAHDRVRKFKKYLQHGVREYWIVDPDSKTLSVNVLSEGKYVAAAYSDEDAVPVHVLEGCTIDLSEVFREK